MYAFCDTFVRIHQDEIIQLNFNNLQQIKNADSRAKGGKYAECLIRLRVKLNLKFNFTLSRNKQVS